MRSLVGLAPLLFVLAACGSGGGGTATPTTGTTRASADPGLDAVLQMEKAVRSNNRVALWGLLSTPARKQLGPTLKAFQRGGGPSLERRFRSLGTRPIRSIVSERITGRFGVVAVKSGGRVFAVPLRHENGAWKLDLGGGPIAIRVLGPDVGSVGRVSQIAYEIRGAPEGATAVIYVDGVTLQSREAIARGTATVYANLESPLTPGRHNAVAFATAGDAAAREGVDVRGALTS